MAANLVGNVSRRVLSKSIFQSKLLTANVGAVSTLQKRCLNLQEYCSKKLMASYGVNVQRFGVAETPEEALKIGNDLMSTTAKELVIKAQILAGGRGKGSFDSGLKGGVHLTKDPHVAKKLAEKMIGFHLTTKQTPPNGVMVKKLMVAQALDIKRETYLAFLMDRESNGPVVVASPEGGMDIEEVAHKYPDKLMKEKVDILQGITLEQADRLAAFLEFRGGLHTQASLQIRRLYDLFMGVDATQVEINPFGETPEGEVVSFDAKINFDDSARFRHEDIFAMDDKTESDPREVEAEKYNLNFVPLDGYIGCMVNGAGLAMATMDIIKLHGGWPANFLDLGGGVNENGVIQGFKILTADKNVRAILVNIFGGIVDCAIIARGITKAYQGMKLAVPVVVRLEGTNVGEARRILEASNMPIVAAADLDDAARKSVQSLQKK